jgi:hypothetical protein
MKSKQLLALLETQRTRTEDPDGVWPFRSAEGLIVAAFFVSIGGGILWVTAKDWGGADDPACVFFMALGGSVEGIGLLLAVIAGRVLQAAEQYRLQLGQEEEEDDGSEEE